MLKRGVTLIYCIFVVNPELKGGNLGSWMATKGASLNAADYIFPIEI